MQKKKDPKEYMQISIDVMKKSVNENRDDGKILPKVGAVLVRPDGTYTTAYRGELRDGDHAEFTLIERKCISENLEGCEVYSTLEPCFERNSPKIGCCKRIVKARISKVYVGTTDPDPTVNGKGIKYLTDHGVCVEMYPRDLQKEIEDANSAFMKDASARRDQEENKAVQDYKGENEQVVSKEKMQNLDARLLNRFLKASGVPTSERDNLLVNMELAAKDGKQLKPTGLGMLLFGNHPQSVYPNAVIKSTLKKDERVIETKTFEGPISRQLDEVAKWYMRNLPSHIDRESPERKVVYDYPLEVVREIICNALVHRDYSEKGAPVYFEINDQSIVVKSPGEPKSPISIKQVEEFSAPSFSRNPVIMYVLDKLKYVEQRGLGFETIKTLPQKGLPLPIVTYNKPYIQFTLPLTMDIAAQKVYADLTENEIKVLEFIRTSGKISRNDVQNEFALEGKTAVRTLNKLIAKGYIVAVGKAKNTAYTIKEGI